MKSRHRDNVITTCIFENFWKFWSGDFDWFLISNKRDVLLNILLILNQRLEPKNFYQGRHLWYKMQYTSFYERLHKSRKIHL